MLCAVQGGKGTHPSLQHPERFLEQPDSTFPIGTAHDSAGVDRLRDTAAVLVDALCTMLGEGVCHPLHVHVWRGCHGSSNGRCFFVRTTVRLILECGSDSYEAGVSVCPARAEHLALPTCMDGAHSPGSAFARGLPWKPAHSGSDDRSSGSRKPAKWINDPTYCDAMEPLLPLAARDTDHFSDRTGEETKPQVHGGLGFTAYHTPYPDA